MHYNLKKLASNLVLLLGVTMFLSSCKDKQASQTAPPPSLQVIEVEQSDIPIYRDFVGHVYGEKDIPIRARVEGFLEGIFFSEGLPVKKGQLLYSIDPKPFEAKVNSQKSRVAEAQTHLAKAESDLNRYKPLAEVKAVSESDLDAAQAQYDAAVSSLKAAQSNLLSAEIELGYCKIYSPISGFIGKTEAKVGDFVGREPNPVILNVVSQIDEVRVEFFITEAEYLTVIREFINESDEEREARRAAEEDVASLELYLSDGSKYEHNGTVDFIDRGIDATTGSMLVQSRFPNPSGILRPGLFGKVKVNFGVIEDGIKIPQRCVRELQGQFSVFVVSEDNKVEARQVQLGSTINDYWIVKEGLKPGEKILMEGLQLVRSGMPVKPEVVKFESQFSQQ